jgi:hypothetical protein
MTNSQFYGPGREALNGKWYKAQAVELRFPATSQISVQPLPHVPLRLCAVFFALRIPLKQQSA